MSQVKQEARVEAEARLFDILEEPDAVVRARAYREGTRCFYEAIMDNWDVLVREVRQYVACDADADELVSSAIWQLYLVVEAKLEANPEATAPKFELRREVGLWNSTRILIGRPLKNLRRPGLLSDHFRKAGKVRDLIRPDFAEEAGGLDPVIADENRRIAEALRVEPYTAEKIDAERQRAALRDCLPTAGRNVLVTVARHGFDLNSRQDLIELVEKMLPRRESRKVVSRLRRERPDEYDGGPVPVELLSRILDLSVRTISRMAERGMAELLELLGAWRPKIAA